MGYYTKMSFLKDIVFQSQNPTLCFTVLNLACHGDYLLRPYIHFKNK